MANRICQFDSAPSDKGPKPGCTSQPSDRTKRENQSCEKELLRQPVEHAVRALAHAGMHRRWLDDGAARRSEPVEALALRQLCDGASRGVARADAGNGLKMLLDKVGVS